MAAPDFLSPVFQTDSLGVKRSTMQVNAHQDIAAARALDDVLSAWDDPSQTTARHPGFFKPNIDWMADEPAAPPAPSASPRFPGGDPLFTNNHAAQPSTALASSIASPMPGGAQPSASAFSASHQPPVAQGHKTGPNLRPAPSNLSVGDLISLSASLPAISFNPLTGVRPAPLQDEDDHTINEPEVTMRVPRPLPPPSKSQKGLWFLRALLLLFLGVAIGLFVWMRLQHHTPIVGKSLSRSLYQAYLPIESLFQEESTLSLVLPSGWHKGPLGRNLEERVFSLRDKLKQQRVRYVLIFSPRKQLLYRIDLDKQI
jgi:hypothetical protein